MSGDWPPQRDHSGSREGCYRPHL